MTRPSYASSRLTAAIAFVCALSLAALPAFGEGLQRRLDVSTGGTLQVAAEGASIDVETGTSNSVEIEIRRGRDSEEEILDDFEIDIRLDGNRVILEADRRSRVSGFFGLFHKGLEIDVRIPRRFDVELATSGGSIQIAQLQGTVNATTSGGSLRFDAIDGDVNARTSGGSITIEECTGETRVRTSGGSIRLHELRGTVNAATSGGSVKAYISEQPGGDSKLATSGGSVTVYLDESIGVDLDAHTSGGRVSTDFALASSGGSNSKNEIAAVLNGGGPQLLLRTSGGSIQVLKR